MTLDEGAVIADTVPKQWKITDSSETVIVTCGVPQNSVPRNILFIYFNNDLPSITLCKI